MKNSSNGLISTLSRDEERISELEDIATESSKTEKQREQRLKENRTKYLRTVRQLHKV